MKSIPEKGVRVKMSVRLPQPPSPSPPTSARVGGSGGRKAAAARQEAQAKALLSEAQRVVVDGVDAPGRAAKRREEFARLSTPPSGAKGKTSPRAGDSSPRPGDSSPRADPDKPRAPITNWRVWCREATEVSQQYQNGAEVTRAITDLQDDAMSIQLPDSAEDAKRMVALKKELQGHAVQLAALAYNEMQAMAKVKDFRKVRGMLVAHERLAETNQKTRRQWVQLQDHCNSLLDEARAKVVELTNTEASVDVLERRLAEIEEFASDLRSEFDKAREEVQMREDTARYELQKVRRDSEATIGELSAMILKWAAATSVVKERNQVQSRLDADIETAQAAISSATACDEILVIDACLRKYARTCGDHLSAEIQELEQRGEDLRNDILERLTSAAEHVAQPDPMKLSLLLERSNDYGANFDKPRRKAAQRLKRMEQAADAEIREMIPSTDYAGIQAVQKKFEGWPAGIQGALGMLENRREWLLSEATAACRRTRTSTDITVLHSALEKYADYCDDCPAFAEVRKQHEKQLLAAIADLRETTVDASATIGDVEATITRWNGVPGTESAGSVLAERLARMTAPAEAELQRAFVEPRLSDVDAVLQKYMREGGPSLLGSASMVKLKRHRSKLCDDMRAQLRLGLSLEDALDIASLLEASVEYEQDLLSDRKALRLQRLKLARRAAELMGKLQSSKDFVSIEKLLARYEGCPPEALEAREGLQKHRKTLIAKANTALTRALKTDVPEIDITLQKFQDYTEACKPSVQALRTRRDQRVQEIKDDLDQCLTLLDLKKWEDKYGTYKAISDLVRDMRGRFAYIVREITAECNAAADTKDFPVIERTLHKHDPWAKHVDTPYRNLRRLSVQLISSMEHDLKQCTAGIYPKPILAVVKRSEPFGGSVAKPRAAAQARIAVLIQGATKAMKAMCNSKRYTAVVDMINQYIDFANETQTMWQTLCDHRDALIKAAKTKIFELQKSTDPNAIDKILARYAGKDKEYPGYDYGNVVEDAVHVALKRRAELIGAAVAEMQAVLMSAEVDGHEIIRDVLQKYQAYPADLDVPRDLLKTKNKMMCQSTTDRIKTAARSHEFEVVDLCISFCLQQKVDNSLTSLVEKLHQHRSRLVERAVGKLEQSLKYEKPAEIDLALNEAGPLFASALFYDNLMQTEGEQRLDTVGDEAKHVQDLREKVETYRSKLVSGCATKMDEILQDDIPKALEKYLGDLVAFSDVEACKQRYGEMETRLKAHQNAFREQIEELLLLDQPHPNEIKRLLAEREKFGPSVVAEERRLSARLLKAVRTGNAQLLSLTTSSDYAAVRTAVQQYSDFPHEFADNFKLLRGHQIGLLEKAMQQFKMMCKEAQHPNEIFSKAPPYYDIFLDEFEPEKEIADARVAQMVQHANDAMYTAQEGHTIWEMQATMDSFAEYPKHETEEARASLASAIAKLAKHQSSTLLALCDSQDIAKIDAALAEKPFPLVMEAHNALREYREQLEAAAAKVCDQAMVATLPKDLDAAIEGARPFGRGLELKRAAVMKRRRTVIKNARTQMSKVDTTSFPLVDAAVAEFDGFAIDTDAPWKMLVARRNELLDGCNEVLRQALRLHDPLQVDEVVEHSLPFAEFVAEARQAALNHSAALCEGACAAMKRVQDELASGECTLATVESVLDKYSYLSTHGPVKGAFEDLEKAFNSGCDHLDRIVVEAVASPDIVHCHELIKQKSTGCRATKEMVAKLVSHRADLIAQYRTRITKATAFVVDVDAVAMLLEEVAPHEKHIGSKHITALKDYLNDLVDGIMRELTSMLRSNDFSKVCQVLKHYANDEDKAKVPVKVKKAISQLRQHRVDLIEKAKQRLEPLSVEQNPNSIDKVLKIHAPFGDTVDPELSQALAQRKKLIDDAIHDMLSKTADNAFKTLSPHQLTALVASLHAVMHRYAHYPDVDMDSTRKKVLKYKEKVISACDDRLNAALTCRTFEEAEEIEMMLTEFSPIEEHVSESYHLLNIHVARIYKWDTKKFAREKLQPCEQEQEELLTSVTAKKAHKQEQQVLKALAQTYMLEQKNETQNLFRENTPAKALRQHSVLMEQEPKPRPSAASIRAGLEVQREASAHLFKGGSAFYLPGFDYHKLEWTMEDELAARFASQEGEDPGAFSRPVTVEMSLAMDYDATVADPKQRAEFTKNFIEDLANSLGCDPSLLNVDGLAKGSVIVKFTLKASEDSDGPSPVSLGAKLNTMMQNPSSALMKSKLLNKVNRARGLLVAAKPLPESKVVRLNHRKGMVNSREFSLHLYVSKFRAGTRLGELQLREGNSGLMETLDSTCEQLTALEQQHEQLYTTLMQLHNELQWIEQPYLWAKLEGQKQKLKHRLESQTKEYPKVVLRSGMSNGTPGWSHTDWMNNSDMVAQVGGSVIPDSSPQKIPVPPGNTSRARRPSAPVRKVSQLCDGALSSDRDPTGPVVNSKYGERAIQAAVTIQSFVRGTKGRLKYRAEVEDMQQEKLFKKQLAQRHGIELKQLPTKMEIAGACHELGINPHHPSERELVWLAEEYLLAPLPKGWTEMYLSQYKAVVYITEQGESSWAHPRKGYFIGLVRELRRLRAEYAFVAKDGLFAVAKVGAKIKAVLDAHAEEQTRLLNAEADQLSGAEWTQSTYVVDGQFAGDHLADAIKTDKVHRNAYDPRRVITQKIRDKDESLTRLQNGSDPASAEAEGQIDHLNIELEVLRQDLEEANKRADNPLGDAHTDDLSPMPDAPMPPDASDDVALDDALGSLPALPMSSSALAQPRLARGSEF